MSVISSLLSSILLNDVTLPTSGFSGSRIPLQCLGNQRYRSNVGAYRRGGAWLFASQLRC